MFIVLKFSRDNTFVLSATIHCLNVIGLIPACKSIKWSPKSLLHMDFFHNNAYQSRRIQTWIPPWPLSPAILTRRKHNKRAILNQFWVLAGCSSTVLAHSQDHRRTCVYERGCRIRQHPWLCCLVSPTVIVKNYGCQHQSQTVTRQEICSRIQR